MSRLELLGATLIAVALCCAGCPATTGTGSDPTTPTGAPTASARPSAAPSATTPVPSTSAGAEPSAGPDAVVLARLIVEASGGLLLDGERLDGLDALEARLRTLCASHKVELRLVASPGVPYSRVAAIMDRARKAGVSAVNIEAAPRATEPPVPGPSMTVSSSPPTSEPPGRPTLPTTNSGDASRITPPVSLPTSGSPVPITPPPSPSSNR